MGAHFGSCGVDRDIETRMNNFVAGNRIRLLRTGAEYFPALEAAIDGAAEIVSNPPELERRLPPICSDCRRGLIGGVAIVALLIKFLKQLWFLAVNVFTLTSDEMIISILTLVDSALIAALLLIIGFSGYENFVSKIGTGE